MSRDRIDPEIVSPLALIGLLVGFGLPLLVFLLLGFLSVKADGPRLVGYECQGASGPLYAQEEDDFPPCKRIEKR